VTALTALCDSDVGAQGNGDRPQSVPMEQFRAITEIPIVIYYGDNIPSEPTNVPAQDSWRARLEMARLWRDAVTDTAGTRLLCTFPNAASTATPISRSPT
jgi:hypothetical protein